LVELQVFNRGGPLVFFFFFIANMWTTKNPGLLFVLSGLLLSEFSLLLDRKLDALALGEGDG